MDGHFLTVDCHLNWIVVSSVSVKGTEQAKIGENICESKRELFSLDQPKCEVDPKEWNKNHPYYSEMNGQCHTSATGLHSCTMQFLYQQKKNISAPINFVYQTQ